MPLDGLTEADTSNLALSSDDEDKNGGGTNALERIKQEAQQVSSFRRRGVRNVTAEFRKASSQLLPGQLVKDEAFTLFEAVGALEIMDPKMDSGYVAPDDTFEPDFDLTSPMDATEVIWIMDQLLCLESTWLEGYPLSQTVFTSLHVDSLLSPDGPIVWTQKDDVVNAVLRPYCEGVIKCCYYALQAIQSQNFYEEEDFVTHLFGRELLPALSHDAALESLNGAVEWVRAGYLPENNTEALISRLHFRIHYFQALGIDRTETSWHYTRDCWDEVLEHIRCIKDTHGLSKAIPEAFSEKIQHQLATSTPPRPMLQVSFDTAYAKWTEFCGEHILATYNLAESEILSSPHCLQRAIWAFAYRGQPNTLARAETQSLLFNKTAPTSDYEVLLTDLRDLVLAGDTLADRQSFDIEVTSDPRHQCARLMEGFMDKVIDEYLNLYRMVCQNRCRIRRLFTQAIGIWDGVETEAWRVDQEIKDVVSPIKIRDQKSGQTLEFDPLFSWAKFYKLRIMAWTIQLGLETDVYMPDELSGMYWYLSVLCEQRSTLIDHIDRFVLERSKRVREAEKMQDCGESHKWLRSMHHLSEISQSIAVALWKFYGLLRTINVTAPPKRDFADPQLLYEARMKPFLSVGNDLIPSLEDFESAQQNLSSIDHTCKAIEEGMKKTKTIIAEVKKYSPEQAKYVGTEEEWKKEIKQTETMCVAIAVAASQLQRISKKHGKDDLSGLIDCTFEKKYHEWWVIPKLKERVK